MELLQGDVLVEGRESESVGGEEQIEVSHHQAAAGKQSPYPHPVREIAANKDGGASGAASSEGVAVDKKIEIAE